MKNHTEVEVLQFNALHFSDQTYKNWSFGHQALFDEIPNLQFSKNIDPGQLLFAEPNAALKILRGELIRREQLEYPEGRKFEDYAFHVKSLLNAKNVAIVNATLLFQRMNRSGNQITSSRDTSRFDILDELEISFKEINFINDSKANKEFLRLVIRSVDWCARMLPSQHLNKFAEKYFAIMSSQKKFLLEIKVPDLRLSFTENMTLIALQRGSKQLWVDLILRNPSFKMLLAVRRMAMDSKHIRKISRILGA
jgi:hypothetical protein